MKCRYPKISIITPVYNSVSTIERTILSVVNQNENNIEYIIVDGLSSDGTDAIVNKYSSYIAKYIRENDTGVYDAINKGIEFASGDIIGIINGDDWYETGCVKSVIEAFQKSDCDIIYGDFNIFDGTKIITNKAGDLKRICIEMVIPHPTVFVKKCVYDRIGKFDTKYRIAADYELMLRGYMSKIQFGYISKTQANFSLGGLSTTNDLACKEETQAIMSRWIDDSVLAKCFEKKLEHELVVRGAGFWGTWIVDKLKKLYTDRIIWIDEKLGNNGGVYINGMRVFDIHDDDTSRQVLVAIYDSDSVEYIYNKQGRRVVTVQAILQMYMDSIYKSRKLVVCE